MSKMVDIDKIGIMKIPFSTTFRTSKTETNFLENVIVVLKTEDELIGIGEAAPTKFTGETQETVVGAIKGMSELIKEKNITNYGEISKKIKSHFRTQYSARTAIEIALFDALSKYWQVPLSDLSGGNRKEVTTDATVPILNSEKSLEIVQKHVERGFETVKVKVGRNLEEDLERLSKIYKKYPNLKIRIDANQAFDPKEALKFLKKIEEIGIYPEIFEQPVGRDNFLGLKFLKENSDVKVAADESLFTARDALNLVKKDAVDVLNLKIMESGLVEAFEIISIGSNSDMDLMIGCMGESDISIKTSASIAAGTGEFNYIDLDSQLFLENNATEMPLKPSIKASEKCGHGASLDYLEKYIDWIE